MMESELACQLRSGEILTLRSLNDSPESTFDPVMNMSNGAEVLFPTSCVASLLLVLLFIYIYIKTILKTKNYFTRITNSLINIAFNIQLIKFMVTFPYLTC